MMIFVDFASWLCPVGSQFHLGMLTPTLVDLCLELTWTWCLICLPGVSLNAIWMRHVCFDAHTFKTCLHFEASWSVASFQGGIWYERAPIMGCSSARWKRHCRCWLLVPAGTWFLNISQLQIIRLLGRCGNFCPKGNHSWKLQKNKHKSQPVLPGAGMPSPTSDSSWEMQGQRWANQRIVESFRLSGSLGSGPLGSADVSWVTRHCVGHRRYADSFNAMALWFRATSASTYRGGGICLHDECTMNVYECLVFQNSPRIL